MGLVYGFTVSKADHSTVSVEGGTKGDNSFLQLKIQRGETMSAQIEAAKKEMAKKIDPAKVADPIGACVYNAGDATFCATLTKAQCDGLSGIWFANDNCQNHT